MRTDYKVGLALGLALAILLAVIVGTRPRSEPARAPAREPVRAMQTMPEPDGAAQKTSTAPGPYQPAPEPNVPPIQPQTAARIHTVREEQTLSDIAELYYGTPDLWPKIYRANRSVIKDPDRIYPGMRLVIPD